MNEIHINGATLLMPNYILSRTSPPAHIYERKINLGYGIKVDTSDAPTNQAQKGKEMNDVKEVLDVADKPVATAAFADGTVLEGHRGLSGDKPDTALETQKVKTVEEVQREIDAVGY